MSVQPCACGCGRMPGVCKVTNARRGLVKGAPNKYVNGHRPSSVGERNGHWKGGAAVAAAARKAARVPLTAERLREVLSYNENTGVFTWLVKRGGPATPGGRAGSPSSGGYISISVDGKLYKAHRLAWLYVHGEWPTQRIDHENGDTSDNRRTNLRLATHSQNIANSRLRVDNAARLKGVAFDRQSGLWLASICKDKQQRRLGRFATAEEAHAAYVAAAKELHGDFARAG